MMAGSKIVLQSSDVDEYSIAALRSTITRIVNPTCYKGMILATCHNFYDFSRRSKVLHQ